MATNRTTKTTDMTTNRTTQTANMTTMSKVQGARHEQLDSLGVIDNSDLKMHIVCDGHGEGGMAIAQTMTKQFEQSISDAMRSSGRFGGTPNLRRMVEAAFDKAVAAVDTEIEENPSHFSNNAGSTMSVVAFYPHSKECLTLQLGDSVAAICDGTTGDIIHSTQMQQFDSPTEVERMLSLAQDGWTFECQIRNDCLPPEERVVGVLRGNDRVFMFNEPSRGVENRAMYPVSIADKLAALQRQPVVHVFELPPDRALILFCCSDGFFSQCAFPNLESLTSCLCDPEAYMGSQNITSTCLERVLVAPEYRHILGDAVRCQGPTSTLWGEDPTKGCYNLMKLLAPDERWEQAVQTSWDEIAEIRRGYPGRRVPQPSSACMAAVSATANLAVLLMSDDNVSMGATFIQTVSPQSTQQHKTP